jgi:hypothetical protein
MEVITPETDVVMGYSSASRVAQVDSTVTH